MKNPVPLDVPSSQEAQTQANEQIMTGDAVIVQVVQQANVQATSLPGDVIRSKVASQPSDRVEVVKDQHLLTSYNQKVCDSCTIEMFNTTFTLFT
jgi:hypothetical protein